MLRAIWILAEESVLGFIEDRALSRGAAIAYYTVTSLGPILVLAIAAAGLVFGHDAARGAIGRELGGMIGSDGARVLQDVVRSADSPKAGTIAGIAGLLALLVTASGAFGEIQSALNQIWRASVDPAHPIGRVVRARMVSLGLVATLGFLLLASLVVSSAITVFTRQIDAMLPFGDLVTRLASLLVSYALITVLFAAIYKVLPDRALEWRDVVVGALVTAALFTIGKAAIGLYLGSSTMGSSYGAAGGLIVLFVWVYYTAQIFLLGAEFTRAFASNHGSLRGTEGARALARAAHQPVSDEPAA